MTNKHELPLHHVTVLTDGAILTHVGKLDLPKGEQVITITKLSEFLDENSIRVKGKGKMTLIDVSPKMEYIRVEDQELLDIDEEIKELELKIKEKQVESEVIETSMTTLDETFKNVGEGFGEWGLRKGLTADDFNKYYEYYQKGARAERKKVLSIHQKTLQLNKQIDVLRRKKQQISRSDNQFYEVHITLDVASAGNIELDVSYTTRKSKWNPLYTVDLSGETAVIQRLARVYNLSGYDWENVGVTITTATRAPVKIDSVNPFYLRLAPIYKQKTRRRDTGRSFGFKAAKKPAIGGVAMNAVAEEAKMDDFMREKEREEKPEEPAMAVSTSDVSLSQTGHQRFELKGKHSIPSGKIPKTLHLDQIELDLEKLYYWSGSQTKLILTHEIENSQYFLLPGNAKVFIEGEYISQTYIDMIHPKEKFTLGVVESYDLKIEKKLKLREVSKKGLVKGKRLMDFGYEIKIENQIDDTCTLKLVDRIPHALDENIEVELNNILPEPDEKNQGVFEWKLELAKDDERTISYDYSVKYPPERTLQPSL